MRNLAFPWLASNIWQSRHHGALDLLIFLNNLAVLWTRLTPSLILKGIFSQIRLRNVKIGKWCIEWTKWYFLYYREHTYSAFRKYSHPLTFSTWWCVTARVYNGFNWDFVLITGLHTITHNVKVELCFGIFLQIH